VNGEQLRDLMTGVFAPDLLREYARECKFVERERQLDVVRFVLSLVLAGGTENSGRQYEVLRTYLESGAPRSVEVAPTRGSMSTWNSSFQNYYGARNWLPRKSLSFCRAFLAP